MKKFKVAFASNDWYAEHLAVAIYSLLKNLSEDYFVEIIILDWWISEKNRKMIENICSKSKKWKADFIIMDRKKFENLPTTWLSQEIYYRLDLPELLPNDWKIIYLDVDVIVNWNLWELIDTDLNGNVIWAIWEITTINYYKDDYNLSSKNRWLFFNSWVLLMDLEEMRKMNFKEKFYNWMDMYIKKLTFHDQDILNILLENKRLLLHPKFNALPFLRTTKNRKILKYSKKEFKEAKKNPVIVHYASKKPWNNTCFHPLEYLYHQYREEIWLPPIVKKKVTLKSLFEKYFSLFWLILISNLPNCIFRYIVYKPYKRFLKRIKYSNK